MLGTTLRSGGAGKNRPRVKRKGELPQTATDSNRPKSNLSQEELSNVDE
jgi:hypothetical protein